MISCRYRGGGLDRGHDATGLSRRVAASLPSGADARCASDRGVGRATDPHRQLGLYGLRRDGDTLQLVEGAVEVDRLLSPQAADDLEALVGLATARLRVHAERLPFGRQRATNAEGRQQAAVRQHVDGGALLSQQHGVAERQRHDVHAEPQAPRAPCQGRHRGH